jgi:hypothetical protein
MFPFTSPPTTRRATVEVFDPASTRDEAQMEVTAYEVFITVFLECVFSEPVYEY